MKTDTVEMVLWDAKRVKEALIEAHLVLFDTTGRIGPKQFKSNLPEHVRNFSDFWAAWQIGTQSQGRNRAKVQRTAREISHSDMVLLGGVTPKGINVQAWLRGPLALYPEWRDILVWWVLNEVAKVRGHRYLTTKEYCHRIDLSERTFRWQRDRAAEIIAEMLNGKGVEAW